MPPWLGTLFLSEYYFELKGNSLLTQPSTLPATSPSSPSSTKPSSPKNSSKNKPPTVAGTNLSISTKNKALSMLQSSTVTFLFKFRLVPQGRRRRWEHWHYEKSKKIHPGPRWDRISPNDDQVQTRCIRPVRMASGQLRAIVHLQELVSILHPVHQGLRCTMGVPAFDRFSVSQVP